MLVIIDQHMIISIITTWEPQVTKATYLRASSLAVRCSSLSLATASRSFTFRSRVLTHKVKMIEQRSLHSGRSSWVHLLIAWSRCFATITRMSDVYYGTHYLL
jgi:hypothetical protein